MRINKLGSTGLFVSELCLGTMTFGGAGDVYSKMGNLDQADANRFVARAFEAGINFIDTADAYSGGVSEQITGQALRNLKVPRDAVLIATKGYSPTGPGPNCGGNSRLHLLEAVHASLRRLQLDHIDLYQVHGFDAATPIEETVRALDTLVQHGHVRYVGLSNWAAWQIMKALGISERLGLAKFASVQAYYSVTGRDIEREIGPLLASEQLGLMVWSPLAGGLLSGKYSRQQETIAGDRRSAFAFPPVDRDRAFDCIDAMRPMADSRGVSVAQIAIAWLLHRKAVSSVIVGARRLEQLEENIAAVDIEFAAHELDALDRVSSLPSEYPGWMQDTMAITSRRSAERNNAR